MNFLDELIHERGSGLQQYLTSRFEPSPQQALGLLPKAGPLTLDALLKGRH